MGATPTVSQPISDKRLINDHSNLRRSSSQLNAELSLNLQQLHLKNHDVKTVAPSNPDGSSLFTSKRQATISSDSVSRENEIFIAPKVNTKQSRHDPGDLGGGLSPSKAKRQATISREKLKELRRKSEEKRKSDTNISLSFELKNE